MKQRNLNLDILRCIGSFFVIAIHFLHETGYFHNQVTGFTMHLGMLLKNCFISCVPIFLMLTGYLMNHKNVSTKYYIGITKVLSLYGIGCIPIWIFQTLYYNRIFSIKDIFVSFISFENYSWYIGMYIGLYALIPFLNVMYHQLETKENKLLLIGTLIFVTSLPSLTNLFIPNFLPKTFESIYPLTYYILGIYISEYEKEIKLAARQLFRLYFIIILIGSIFSSICIADRFYYVEAVFTSYENILTVCSTTVLFLAILKCDFSKLPHPVCCFIEATSKCSLQLFMVSYIFDTIVYEKVNLYYSSIQEKMPLLPIITLIIFGASFIIAYITQLLYDYIRKSVT